MRCRAKKRWLLGARRSKYREYSQASQRRRRAFWQQPEGTGRVGRISVLRAVAILPVCLRPRALNCAQFAAVACAKANPTGSRTAGERKIRRPGSWPAPDRKQDQLGEEPQLGHVMGTNIPGTIHKGETQCSISRPRRCDRSFKRRSLPPSAPASAGSVHAEPCRRPARRSARPWNDSIRQADPLRGSRFRGRSPPDRRGDGRGVR